MPESDILRRMAPFALNVLGYEKEGFHVFLEEEHFEGACAVGTAISESVATGQAVELERCVPREAVLMGFHLYVEDLDHEVALVAWTEAGDESGFRCIAATEGTADRVALPESVALPMAERAARSIRTSALLVHNHPPGPLRDFLAEELGLLPGPSSADRELVAGLRNACASAGGHVSIEAWLLESDIFRPVRLDPAETIAKRCLEGLQAVADFIDRSNQGGR